MSRHEFKLGNIIILSRQKSSVIARKKYNSQLNQLPDDPQNHFFYQFNLQLALAEPIQNNKKIKITACRMSQNPKSFQYEDFQNQLLDNQYKIGQMIDEGGYSAVFYAQDKNGKPKAIKFTYLNLPAQRKKMQNSLKQEDQAMRSIICSQVIQCEQSKVDQKLGFKYIVMELCNYFNLWHLILYKGHLKEIEAKIYIKNILAGLISMHHFGYSHRDIKSCNICIKNGHCVIIDLGCSKKNVNTEQGQKFNLTVQKCATIAGTITNKSPQMLSEKKYSYRTDFWGIGILFYEMLTGVVPFKLTGDESDQDALKIIKENIDNIYNPKYITQRIKQSYQNITDTFPSRACNKISVQAQKFLKKLITINPEDRFSQQELKNSEYLIRELQIQNIWDAAECLLPLSNINWKQFTKNINEVMQKKKSSQYKSIIEQQSPRSKEQQHEQQFQIKNLSQQQKIQLKQNYQNTIKQDKKKLNKMMVLHFEINRIKLLLEVREQLIRMNCQQLELQPLIYYLIEFCQKKIVIINGHAYIENVGIFSNGISSKFKKTFLSEYLNQLYLEDNQKYQKWLLKHRINPKTAQKTNLPKTKSQQLIQKLKPITRNQKLKTFLYYHQKILEFEYKPEPECFEWIKWKSLETIIKQRKYQEKL